MNVLFIATSLMIVVSNDCDEPWPCSSHPVGIYLLKVNTRNPRASCEICSKLTIKTPERR